MLDEEHPGDDDPREAYESCKKSKVSSGKKLPLYVIKLPSKDACYKSHLCIRRAIQMFFILFFFVGEKTLELQSLARRTHRRTAKLCHFFVARKVYMYTPFEGRGTVNDNKNESDWSLKKCCTIIKNRLNFRFGSSLAASNKIRTHI